MTVRVLPDIPAIAVAFLKQHASITAEEFANIGTKKDPSGALPSIVIRRLGGAAKKPGRYQHSDSAVMQIDVRAQTDEQASRLALLVQGVLVSEMKRFRLEGQGSVTQCLPVMGARPLPDLATDQERYELEVRIDAHR